MSDETRRLGLGLNRIEIESAILNLCLNQTKTSLTLKMLLQHLKEKQALDVEVVEALEHNFDNILDDTEKFVSKLLRMKNDDDR